MRAGSSDTPVAAVLGLLEAAAKRGLPRRAVVALSGGADSVALLLAAREAAGRAEWSLAALHCDHGLRGRASAADRRWVEAFCAGLGVALQVFKARLRPGAGMEERARDWRRECYALAAKRRGAPLVLLGHHQRDQAETVLMNLARGAGWRGGAGMRRLSPLAKGSQVRLGRPFLGLAPEALRAWLRARGQDWREDASNASDKLGRNRVRLKVLPELGRVQPEVVRNLARYAGRARRAEAALGQLAALEARRLMRGMELGLDGLAALPAAARREVLRAWSLALGRALDSAALGRLGALARQGEGSADLGGAWKAQASAGRLRLGRHEAGSAIGARTLGLGRPLKLAGWTLRLERKRPPLRMAGRRGRESAYWFSTQAGAPWKVRPPKPGERLRPFGSPGTKLVADCLAEARVPVWERGSFPVVQGADGSLLALPGVRRSAAFPLDSKAKEALVLTWERGFD